VIAPSDLLDALQARRDLLPGDVLAFTDAEALLALETIIARRPHAVALERRFAATPRGAALISRIKTDPALAGSEIRVISHDSDYARVLPRAGGGGQGPSPAVAILEPPLMEGEPEVPALDQRGTRRAPRFRVAGEISVQLDGNGAIVVDLSIVGAQVISPTILKPNQRVRIGLTDDADALRFNASIAWASFEISRDGPRYRAGVNFIDANADALAAFCLRHTP
jgi:hypothetical protein